MSYSFGWIEIHCVDHCNNSCKYCNNHSPYAPKKEYESQEYIPWIDQLIGMGVRFYCLSIMGGEPFLHSDLGRFVGALRNRYDHSLMVTTNGFWLSRENIERYALLLEQLDILCISLYPNIVARIGGMEMMESYIDLIRNRFDGLKLEVRDVETFDAFEITSESHNVSRYCGVADCTCLLADGRMARCGIGAFARWNPSVTREFLEAGDMFYDLKNPHEDFWLWRKRWPLRSCSYCTLFANNHMAWEYTRRIPPRLKKST